MDWRGAVLSVLVVGAPFLFIERVSWDVQDLAGLAVLLGGLALLGLFVAAERRAAWPLLDSLTTSFSLLATWLAARARLENWLYCIVINAVMVYLFYAQEVWGMAVLSVLLMGVAVSGYIAWRRRYRAQWVAA